MNPLKCNDDIKSYKYPILKIFIFAIVIIILINRNIFFSIDNVVLKFIIAIVSAALVIICILSIYISFNEIILLYEKRQEANIDINQMLTRAKKVSVNDIITLLKNNDIVEIKAISNNSIIKIGVSSDCCVDSFEFFDKIYYVNDNEFKTVEEVQRYILENISTQSMLVIFME